MLAYYTIRDGIQRDEYNKPIVKCDGKALIEATHCYLEKTNISKEKSIGAKEIVRVICQLLAETGQNGTPHISAATILSRCPVLESQLRNIVNKDGTPDTKHRNQHLKRVFRTVIRLLHTQTESKRFTKTSFFRIRTVWPSRLCKR